MNSSETGQFALARVSLEGGPPLLAFAFDDQLLDVAAACMAHGGGRGPSPSWLAALTNLDLLLADWDRSFPMLRDVAEFVVTVGLEDERLAPHRLARERLRFLPPVGRPGKMIYCAQNYPDHVQEMSKARANGFNDAPIDEARDFTGDRATTRPYAFLKAASALTGPYDDIRMPRHIPGTGEAQIDWEVELAVVIGRGGRDIDAKSARTHIAGFMTTNDLTARQLLFRPDRERLRTDWLGGKSFDGFAPMGPTFTPREFVDHSNLRLRLWVNGELRQDGNTAHLIYSPEEQIEYAARIMTLEPGDIFGTGTPGGVGMASGHFLKVGDVVEAEVAGLGRLRNRIIETDRPQP